MIEFKEAIKKAKVHSACIDAVEVLETLSGWDEFFKHKNAPYWTFWYIENVIKGRWLEGEKAIKKDPRLAYYYARNVIKGRWIEAEEAIKKDPCWAYWYAYNVIKGRWLEGEKAIKKKPFCYKKYCEKFSIAII